MEGHGIVTGMTGCGKSRWVVETLRGPMRKKFNYIILICPTYAYNKTYRDFAKGDPGFLALAPDASDEGELNDILQLCSTVYDDNRAKTLFIVDDCSFSRDVKKRSSEIVRLFCSGRHLGISIYLLTQQYTSVAKVLRDNCSFVVAFHNPSGKDFDSLLDSCGSSLSTQDREKLRTAMKEHKYSRLCFSLRFPYEVVLEIPCSSL